MKYIVFSYFVVLNSKNIIHRNLNLFAILFIIVSIAGNPLTVYYNMIYTITFSKYLVKF